MRAAAAESGVTLSEYVRDVVVQRAAEDLVAMRRRSCGEILVVSNAPSKGMASLPNDLAKYDPGVAWDGR